VEGGHLSKKCLGAKISGNMKSGKTKINTAGWKLTETHGNWAYDCDGEELQIENSGGNSFW
jgi:hypothetical protein